MKKYIFLIFSMITMSTLAQQNLTPETLWQLGRVTPLGISKDGKLLIYKVGTPSIEESKNQFKILLCASWWRECNFIRKN
jgi:hypothetical protein